MPIVSHQASLLSLNRPSRHRIDPSTHTFLPSPVLCIFKPLLSSILPPFFGNPTVKLSTQYQYQVKFKFNIKINITKMKLLTLLTLTLTALANREGLANRVGPCQRTSVECKILPRTDENRSKVRESCCVCARLCREAGWPTGRFCPRECRILNRD